VIKLEKTEVLGWDAAIRGMRNPMNSWDMSDSYWGLWEDESPINPSDEPFFFVGTNDLKLMKNLAKAGTDHRKFMRMLTVYVDITAPLYWWKEFDTYKVGTVANSCSTMHKIHAKEFTLDDFSHEHLTPLALSVLERVVDMLNNYRADFTLTKMKEDWWQMIQLLPTSYNQKRTVMLNYEVLANIYKSRKNHKLVEWHGLCHWIEGLPYSELITG
jgi:hypothetical protein